MSNANKKNKMGEETDSDFDKVRQYILDCPHVSSEHPAIAAAVKGIEQEMKRRERDAKLRQKFMQDAVTIEKPVVELEQATASAITNERQGTSFSSSTNRNMQNSLNSNNNNTEQADEAMTDDWHDVNSDTDTASGSGSPKAGDPAHNNGEQALSDEVTSFLGKGLSRQAIAAIAQHQVQVKSPLAAVALALHAAMRSETLGFGCTGVPDGDDSGNGGGFAAPIRELPKTQFLPSGWDRYAEKVTLRYRKNGTGSLILKVVGQQQATAQEKDMVVEVTLYPTSTGEPPSESLVFPISDHINLDSWARALRENGIVPPALHYKGLSMLLSNFAKTFDLGTVSEDQDAAAAEQARMYVDTTIGNPSSMQRQQQQRQQQQHFQQQFEQQANNPANFQSGPPMRPAVANRQPWDDDGRSPTIDSAFPGLRVNGPPGNFAGDLAPGGIQGPNFGQFDPGMGGMLMGPNHPAFNGGAGGISGVGPNSGMGMRPRFDPFGPPGGPQDPNNNGFPNIPNGPTRPNGNRRPGGGGNPNPDHMRPPNNLGNNMFG
jgi:hypothetical protein